MKSLLLVIAAVCFTTLCYAAEGVRVRVATFNVEHGIGPAGSGKYAAQKAILGRIDADIIAFQELNRRSSNDWVRLAEELKYPYRSWGEMGPFAGAMLVGFYSRYPILESAVVGSEPGAREWSRYPLRITVSVPAACRPLALWNMHHKALFRPVDEFRRALEALRLTHAIQRYVERYPGAVDLVVLGDMNDHPDRGANPPYAPQTVRFEQLPDNLPKRFTPGPDIPFPLAYHPFPFAAYQNAGLYPVDACRESSTCRVSHLHTELTLDYIFVSERLWHSPSGPPRGEVYHSASDRGGGLPKYGKPLPAHFTLTASDHYVVFADLYLEAVGPE